MGCLSSRPKTPSYINGSYKDSVFPITKESPSQKQEYQRNGLISVKPILTEEEVKLVRDFWGKLHCYIDRVGVVFFARLFETHPDVQDSFMDFRHMSIEDIRHSKTLREHGLRVMTTVEKVLSRIDDPDKLEDFIQRLGKQHVTYKANINYIHLVGPQFVKSIKSELEDVWTEQTEKAWLKLFDYVTYLMQKGMKSVQTVT